MAQYYKKYERGIKINRAEINNKFRVVLIDFDANPCDKEVYQYGVIIERIDAPGVSVLIYERDYKTYRGAIRAYKEAVGRLL